MPVYVLSDPHLSLTKNKPMDIFGRRWQAHAQKLAAAEQQAVVQDQNSWKTRIKGVIAAAAGAAGSAFLGTVGGRVGEAAANAVFKP